MAPLDFSCRELVYAVQNISALWLLLAKLWVLKALWLFLLQMAVTSAMAVLLHHIHTFFLNTLINEFHILFYNLQDT